MVLSQELAESCNKVFVRAAGAATSSRNIRLRGPNISSAEANPRCSLEFRERIVQNEASVFYLGVSLLGDLGSPESSRQLLSYTGKRRACE